MWFYVVILLFFAGKPALSESAGVSIVAKNNAGGTLPQAVLTINLALMDGRFYLGEVPSQIRGEEIFAVSREDFIRSANPVLKTDIQETIRKLDAAAGFVPVNRIREAGLGITFDIGQLTLCVNPKVEQRPQGHISLSQGGEITSPDRYAKQAALSGYSNLYGSFQSEGSGGGGKNGITRTLGTASALRVLNLVIENEATFSNGGAIRQGTRLIYDDPNRALRFTAGDMTPTLVGQQGGSSLLGFGLEKSDAKLQPQKNIRPTGERSFRLERPSEVDVYVNGQLLRRLQMPPGDHDISDLPLKPGQNFLRLEITDDTGQHTTLDFSVFYDRTLLAPGIEEWGVAAGVTSTAGLQGVNYNWNNPAATAYYQSGLTENQTATMHVQGDSHAIMGGVLGVSQTPLGYISLEGAASVKLDGTTGSAMVLAYSPEALFRAYDVPGVAQFALNLRSPDFTSILGATGGQASINAFYSRSFDDGVMMSLSGSATVQTELTFGGAISVSKSVAPDWSWSVTGSYSNISPVAGAAQPSCWGIVARLNFKLGENTQISFSRDQGTGKALSEISTHGRTADGNYSVKAQMEADDEIPGVIEAQQQTDLSASYSGSRFDITASTSKRVTQGGGTLNSVSVISGAGAIAFADGQIAAGRPINDSFAIISPHSSLQDATIRAAPGPGGDRGAPGLFGNVLVSDLSAYTPSQLPVQVDGAPDGYDLGSGLFELRPSYRSGYVLQVGSDYSVTAVGLLENKGAPLALISGLAKEVVAAEPHKTVIFTNAEGRFAADGLKPGVWRIEMLSEPPSCFTLAIPAGAAGLFDAGTLKQRCPS